MSHPFSINTLLSKHRLTMVDVVFLSILESLLFVAQFYFIGKAVNDLLNDSWNGVYILIALFAGKFLVSFIKQKRISKTYKTIYDELVVKTIGTPLSAGDDIDLLTPKTTIVYLITDFFKGDLIRVFETIVRLFLVLLALFILNKTIFVIALGWVVIVFLLYFMRKKKTIQISQNLADEFVKEYQILKERKPETVYQHHQALERMDNQLLGISAINLSIIEILSFAFLIISLVVLVKTEGENALGTFFTMLYYVMAFSETMFLLPTIYQKYLRIEEMSKKIG